MQYFGEASPEFIRHQVLDSGQVFLSDGFPSAGHSFILATLLPVVGCWLLVNFDWRAAGGSRTCKP